MNVKQNEFVISNFLNIFNDSDRPKLGKVDYIPASLVAFPPDLKYINSKFSQDIVNEVSKTLRLDPNLSNCSGAFIAKIFK